MRLAGIRLEADRKSGNRKGLAQLCLQGGTLKSLLCQQSLAVGDRATVSAVSDHAVCAAHFSLRFILLSATTWLISCRWAANSFVQARSGPKNFLINAKLGYRIQIPPDPRASGRWGKACEAAR
jgi:hypothetical protein